MVCAVPAVPDTADHDCNDWADDYELPEDAHWDDECPLLLPDSGRVSLGEMMTELHRQAHGSSPIRLCRAEPCSRLDLKQLAVIDRSA